MLKYFDEFKAQHLLKILYIKFTIDFSDLAAKQII